MGHDYAGNLQRPTLKGGDSRVVSTLDPDQRITRFMGNWTSTLLTESRLFDEARYTIAHICKGVDARDHSCLSARVVALGRASLAVFDITKLEGEGGHQVRRRDIPYSFVARVTSETGLVVDSNHRVPTELVVAIHSTGGDEEPIELKSSDHTTVGDYKEVRANLQLFVNALSAHLR